MGFLLTLPIWSSGNSCEEPTPLEYSPEYGPESQQYAMAKKLSDYLEENAWKAAIVSRAGGDLSSEKFLYPAKQKYTHAGIAWKSSEDGQWYFKHLLNICSSKESSIFVQGLPQFFDDSPYYFDFHVVVPSRQLQERIVSVLESDVSSLVHNPSYSKIAHPYRGQYQNSNAWVLNIIGAAQSKIEVLYKDRENPALFQMAIAHYYRNQGFRPSQAQVGRFRAFLANNAFYPFPTSATTRDHSEEEHRTRWFKFVSAESLHHYLDHTDEVIDQREICHDSGCNIPTEELLP